MGDKIVCSDCRVELGQCDCSECGPWSADCETCDYCIFGPDDICFSCSEVNYEIEDWSPGEDDCGDCGAWLGEKCNKCGHYDFHSCSAGDSTIWCECNPSRHKQIIYELDERKDRGYD